MIKRRISPSHQPFNTLLARLLNSQTDTDCHLYHLITERHVLYLHPAPQSLGDNLGAFGRAGLQHNGKLFASHSP